MVKSFPLHGVGKVVFADLLTGREVLRITKQESAVWNFAMEEAEVSGGDDLDVFDIFETSRAQSVTFVDNVFDIRQFEVATGKRPVEMLNVAITEIGEGFNIPDSPGPYTASLIFAGTAEDETVRVRFNDDWEDFAPVPANFTDAGNVTEVNSGAGTFAVGDTIDIVLTAVLNSGIESVGTVSFAHTIVDAVSADLDILLPDFALDMISGMPTFDVNELAGFNVYITDDTNPEYLSNATPLTAGTTYTVVASPGAGAGSADATPTSTGQYTVSSGVITFAAVDASKGVLVDYIWRTSATSPDCTVVDILKNCLRGYLSAKWRVNVKASDGTIKGMEMDIFKLKYAGDYSFEMNRSDPSTHSMEFKILDPDRADKKLVSWKLFLMPPDTGCN